MTAILHVIHQTRYLVHEALRNPSKTLLVPVFHVKHVFEVRSLVRGHHTVQRVSFRHLADHKTPNYTEITRSHILVFYGRIGVKTRIFERCVDLLQGNGSQKFVFREKLALEVSCFGFGVLHGRDLVIGESCGS